MLDGKHASSFVPATLHGNHTIGFPDRRHGMSERWACRVVKQKNSSWESHHRSRQPMRVIFVVRLHRLREVSIGNGEEASRIS